MLTWPIKTRLADGREQAVCFRTTSADNAVRLEETALAFSIPSGKHVYLSSKDNANFALPPSDNVFALKPGTDYVLRGEVELSGGEVTLWLIEYDRQNRLGHRTHSLQSGRFRLAWKTAERHVFCCLALRLSGTGRLSLGSLELLPAQELGPTPPKTRPVTDTSEPRTGPRGRFRAYSIFFDPAAYKPCLARPHHYYDNRRHDWYEPVARAFAGCSSVLDIGCGPGLLLEALCHVGVERVLGLERDPVYLQSCAARGLPVAQHDLNDPFPFVKSASFDGVVSHSSFDYLAPIALRTTLRECLRVLKPNGSLCLTARVDGQASGDEARCSVPLAQELVRQHLTEAGFEKTEVSVQNRVVQASGQRPADDRRGLGGASVERPVAEVGAIDQPDGLTRTVPLEKETQCSLRLAPETAGRGAVLLALEGQPHQHEIRIHADGHCTRNGHRLTREGQHDGAVAACLRIALPRRAQPEVILTVWHGDRRAVEQHSVLDFVPKTLRIRLQVPAGEPALIVDHLDVWQPEPMQVEAPGDAHMYMGVCRTGNDLLPDIDRPTFQAALREHEIGRAIVTTYGSTRQLDSFDQISPLTNELRGRIYPLVRVRACKNLTEDDERFQVSQLELLWQKGLLGGLKVKMNAPEIPSEAVRQWAERRQALTMWHLRSTSDLEWLEENVLRPFTFPVLLSHFGGYPLDCDRYEACIDRLDQYPQLYLTTSALFFASYLERAIRRHPDRILLGSDFPAIDPTVTRAAILGLDIPQASKILVASENLRFLTERMAWHRWQALRGRNDLLFPPLPATPEEVEEQGFEIVETRDLPPDEPTQAREFWESLEVSSFYLEHKPWATLVAELVRDLKPRSVLEFGCHVGRNLEAVREAAPEIRLVGLDINRQAVRVGRERSRLDLRVGDENALAEFKDGEFDLVFTISVLDHIPHIAPVCNALLRIAARNAFFLEVTLPVEGKVVRHFDHKRGGVEASTDASYSWFVDRYIADHPRVWRLDCRPCYLHPSRLGPYYWSYLAFLERPG